MINFKSIQHQFYIALLIGGLSTSIDNVIHNLSNFEHVASISNDFRMGVYISRVIKYEEYDHRLSKKAIDQVMTYETLEKCESLMIHLVKNNTLYDLLKFPSLKKLDIYEAELLTKEDIAYINKCSDLEINLHFSSPRSITNPYNINNLLKNNAINIDMSLFTTKKIKIYFEKDEDFYFLLNHLNNFKTDMFVDENKEQVQAYLNLMNQLENYDIDIEDKFEIKVFKIINFLQDKIDYDKRVSNNKELSHYYNSLPLTTIIGNDMHSNGICINYATLFALIADKYAIDNSVVSGNSIDSAHAWNGIYENDELKYYIDPTNLDKKDIKHLLIEAIDNNIVTEELTELVFSLPSPIYNDYRVCKNTHLDKINVEKDIIIYNKDLDGTKTVNNKYNKLLYVRNIFISYILIELSKKYKKRIR